MENLFENVPLLSEAIYVMTLPEQKTCNKARRSPRPVSMPAL